MTMRVTLDRPAMQLLIDRDPEFEVSLQKAILAEIGKRVLSKDANKIIAQAEPELFAKCLQGLQQDEDITKLVQGALAKALIIRPIDYGSRAKLTDDTKRVIDLHVSDAKERVIRDASVAVEQVFSEKIKTALAKVFEDENLDSRIEKRINRLVEEEIARRADERFKARMADVRSLMA